jgi:carbonic anhydrase
MPVEGILRGLKRFQKNVFPQHKELFEKLALRQRPEALFITCADSRIDPGMLTQTKPGKLFICRVIGNIVPPYPQNIGGVSATIEYAVGVLGVSDVIVCGHTDCGVMKGVLNPEPLEPLANVSVWLRHAQPAREKEKKSKKESESPEYLLALTERNVVEQLKNLHSHPAVATRLGLGNLRLHGWVYHIGQGLVTVYDHERKIFVPTRAPKSKRTKNPAAKQKSAKKRLKS